MTMTRSPEFGGVGDSSTRILEDVSCWRCLMIEPDFPMTAPIREAWQRRRKETWPAGRFWWAG